MILNAQQIREAVGKGDILIKPFEEDQLEAATYDLRVGEQGATTSTKELVNIRERAYLSIAPGDFAVVTIQEELRLGPQHVGRFGLRSKYARKGLIATTGPQIDPGYHGRLILGLTNLTPKAVTIPYGDHLVSVEFHELQEPTEKPYDGPFQGKLELGPAEIEMITDGSGMAFSEVLTAVGGLSKSVAALSEDMHDISMTMKAEQKAAKTQRWLLPTMMGLLTLLVAVFGFFAVLAPS